MKKKKKKEGKKQTENSTRRVKTRNLWPRRGVRI